MYRISKLSFLFVLALALSVISCDKEGIDELTENFTDTAAQNRADEEETMNFNRGGKGKRGGKGGMCFDLVYPITLSFPDGSTEEVADREEAKAAKEAFKTANPDAEGRPSLVFPIQIDQDGTITDVANAEALQAIKETCPRGEKRGGKGRRGNKCFKPVFPITLSFPDGSSAEVADKEAAKAAKKAWKEANPDAEGRPSIAFPFDVMQKDSSIVTLTSQEELEALKESCVGERGQRGGRGGKCFQVNLPISITIDGGEAITINERADKRAALEAWKEANPDATERPEVTLVFPVTVTLEDGTESTLNNQEELEALKESCGGERGRGRRGRG